MKSTICVAEDRRICEVSLKLLLLSLKLHYPEVTVNLRYPAAENGFLSWVKNCPRVRLQTSPLSSGQGWNVKPSAILSLIDEGFDEVIWIDSDVIVIGNIARIFSQLSSDMFVATEDALGDDRDDRNALRARLWGFKVGRVLPFGLNSGVLRVTRAHYGLLTRWRELLQSNTYQESQKRAWKQRPIHMLGDQDVLTALLTSEEFSRIPIQILRRGKQILQFNGVYGYTVAERIGNLMGQNPVFIHSFGGKPWSEKWRPDPSNGLREYIKKVYLDLSPYTLSAAQFKDELACDTEWMEPHYPLSRFLRTVGLGSRELVGLPIAAIMDMARAAKYVSRVTRLTPAVE